MCLIKTFQPIVIHRLSLLSLSLMSLRIHGDVIQEFFLFVFNSYDIFGALKLNINFILFLLILKQLLKHFFSKLFRFSCNSPYDSDINKTSSKNQKWFQYTPFTAEVKTLENPYLK